MVQTPRQPAFVQIVPLASYSAGNPSTSFVQPSLDHQYPLAAAFGSPDYATAPRRNSHPVVGASSSRGHSVYPPAICERRASNPNMSSYPYLAAEHTTKETNLSVQPATRFEVSSPKRKAHYVPATPPRPPQRVPTPPGLNIPRRPTSWDPYPSPPNSPPSERLSDTLRKPTFESPKQSYIPSPPPSPKRRSTPAPKPRVLLPPTPSEDNMKEGDELLSKFRRFALAARETPSDEKCIEDLMDSYDRLMPSLIEEVAVDPRLEFD